jgi:hypothetical protein
VSDFYDDDDDGPCPDCGWDQENARLVSTEFSNDKPCGPCLWAYGEPDALL